MSESLFVQSLRSLIRNAPDSDKLKILQTLLNEVNLSTKTVDIIFSDFTICYQPTAITIKILRRLDPERWSHISYDRFRDHPYVIQIVKEIGREAFSIDIELLQLTLPIHKHYHYDRDGYYSRLSSYIPDDLSVLFPYQDENLKTPEEVSKAIQEVLAENEVKIDPDEVNLWLQSHYSKDCKI